MASLLLAVKGQIVEALFDVVDPSYALLTGQASLVTKSLRDQDGAASETVTVVEQGASGYYKASFTPAKGGMPPTEYLLDITEPSGTAGRQHRFLIQVYDSITQVSGVTGSYLTTLANVRQALGLGASDTTDDAFLTNLIARVSEFIKRATRRALTQTTLTEYHNGRGLETLLLRDWPVISMTSIHESVDLPRVYDSTTLVSSSGYVVDSELGIIQRPFNPWYRAFQSIKAIYVAGYASVPLDLEQLAIDLVVAKYRKRALGDVAARSLMDGSISYFPMSDVTAEQRRVIALYANTRAVAA